MQVPETDYGVELRNPTGFTTRTTLLEQIDALDPLRKQVAHYVEVQHRRHVAKGRDTRVQRAAICFTPEFLVAPATTTRPSRGPLADTKPSL